MDEPAHDKAGKVQKCKQTSKLIDLQGLGETE